VDEFFTFVPDPSSEKGFKLVYSDVGLGYEFIESLDPAIPLQRYDFVHGLGTVGEIANDNGLRSYNEEIQQYYLDPNLDILIAELGLEEEDIILFPALFEPPQGCGDYAAALIPGTANMQLYSYPDGRTVVLPPDPFLRPEGTTPALDPFILEFESLLPETLEYVWIDDFYSYHYGLGEVHCGTNVTRTPSVDWWTEARHLITD
jgi:protein-arginine deiminase